MADTMSGDSTGERNPFAPPPADAPDQPWQPRIPPAGQRPPAPDSEDQGQGEQPQVPPPHPWSPGHRGGGWNPPPPAPKFDPTDPVQRKARYALSSGIGALLCLLLGYLPVSLLLGALAVYWAVSSLRGARTAQGAAPAQGTGGAQGVGGARGLGGAQAAASGAQTPAAVAGLFIGAASVLVTMGWFGTLTYYNDYVVCVQDAPTIEARHSCQVSDPAPRWLVTLKDPDSL